MSAAIDAALTVGWLLAVWATWRHWRAPTPNPDHRMIRHLRKHYSDN